MKYVLKNISIFFKNEPAIIALILLCISASAFVLNFSYGLYTNYQTALNESELEIDRITPEISRYITKGDLQRYIESLQPDTLNGMLVIYATAELDNYGYPKKDCGDFYMRFVLHDHIYQVCQETKDSWEKNGQIVNGRYIDNQEEQEGQLVAVIPMSTDETIDEIPSEIFLFGKPYQVIGVHKSGSGTPVVPFLTVPSDLELKAIGFTFYRNITKKSYDDLISTAEKVLPGCLQFPSLSIPDNDSLYVYRTIILISVFISVVSALNFAILFLFILRKRSHSFAVFRICGARKIHIILIYLGECGAISIPVYLIGTLLFYVCLKMKFQYVFPYMVENFSPNVYKGLFMMYIIVTMIILGTVIVRNVETDIRQSLEEGKR